MLSFFTVIRATHTQEVLGEQGRRIRELTSLIQKRFKFPENSVSLYAAKVQNRGLSAVAQCESLRYKLLNGLAVRRACYGVLRFIMESGAKGCEVVVSGKLRAARAKSMKFTVRLSTSDLFSFLEWSDRSRISGGICAYPTTTLSTTICENEATVQGPNRRYTHHSKNHSIICMIEQYQKELTIILPNRTVS